MARPAKKYWTRLPAEFQTGVCEGSLIHGAGWALKIDVTRADAGLSAVLRGRW
jgi:hypothetical protein